MDYILVILFGSLTGIISGLIPGIGNALAFIILWPILSNFDSIHLIIFFLALISLSQYMGSVSATIFNVPGETSSVPAMIEGNALFRRGVGSIALSGSALGSFFGSFLSISLTWIIVNYLIQLSEMLTVTIEVLIISLAILIVICISNYNRNRYWRNFLISCILASIGLFLAMVGINELTFTAFATFDNPYLAQGLPFFPVLFSIFVLPEITKVFNFPRYEMIKEKKINLYFHYKKILKGRFSIIRGTLIGYVCGIIPGIGTTIASNFSYLIEKYIRISQKRYKNGDYSSLVAAETANNAAAFSSTLPLFVFGIPITLTEILLIKLVSQNNFYFGINSFVDGNLFVIISLSLIIINLIGLIIAWGGIKLIKYIHLVNFKYLMVLIGIFVFCSLVYQASTINQISYHIIVTICLLPIGILFIRYNRIPLIFVFLIYDIYWEGMYRFLLINS